MFPGADGRSRPADDDHGSCAKAGSTRRRHPGRPRRRPLLRRPLGRRTGAPGGIHRISYNPGAPTARLEADPTLRRRPPARGRTSTPRSSTDPDGEALTYDWDLDGDGVFEIKDAGPTRTKAFNKAEQDKLQSRRKEPRTAVVAVRVERRRRAEQRRRKSPSTRATTRRRCTIIKPLTSFEWAVGRRNHLDGSAKTRRAATTSSTPLALLLDDETGLIARPARRPAMSIRCRPSPGSAGRNSWRPNTTIRPTSKSICG